MIQSKASPTVSHPNRFRDTPTRVILDERECWLWDLSEFDRDPSGWAHPESSRAFIVLAIEEADAEIERRKRLRSMRNAPPWPVEARDRRAELSEIKRRLPLRTFIEQYTPERFARAGDQLLCRCPFPDHDDTTPSFYVRPETDVFYCHGCHRGGDLFEFARHFLGLSTFVEVATVLGEWAGVVPGAVYVKTATGMERVK